MEISLLSIPKKQLPNQRFSRECYKNSIVTGSENFKKIIDLNKDSGFPLPPEIKFETTKKVIETDDGHKLELTVFKKKDEEVVEEKKIFPLTNLIKKSDVLSSSNELAIDSKFKSGYKVTGRLNHGVKTFTPAQSKYAATKLKEEMDNENVYSAGHMHAIVIYYAKKFFHEHPELAKVVENNGMGRTTFYDFLKRYKIPTWDVYCRSKKNNVKKIHKIKVECNEID